MLRRLIFRRVAGRVGNQISKGKVGGLGAALIAVLTPILVQLAGEEGLPVEAATVEELLRALFGAFLGLGAWGVRDALDAGPE